MLLTDHSTGLARNSRIKSSKGDYSQKKFIHPSSIIHSFSASIGFTRRFLGALGSESESSDSESLELLDSDSSESPESDPSAFSSTGLNSKAPELM